MKIYEYYSHQSVIRDLLPVSLLMAHLHLLYSAPGLDSFDNALISSKKSFGGNEDMNGEQSQDQCDGDTLCQFFDAVLPPGVTITFMGGFFTPATIKIGAYLSDIVLVGGLTMVEAGISFQVNALAKDVSFTIGGYGQPVNNDTHTHTRRHTDTH